MIIDWCDEPCVLLSKVSTNENQKEFFGSPIPDKCRFEHKTLIIRTAEGVEEQTDGIVYIPNARSWKLRDRFVYEGETFRILERRVYKSVDGPQYQRFKVQREAV